MFRNPNRNEVRGSSGFTLVELLVAMVITGIIGGMVSVALTGASKQAKETRAKAFVDRLNLTMMQLYEVEAERKIGTPSSVWSGETVSQAQMIWKRDWLRASLPQSRADIDAGSGRTGTPNAALVYSSPFLTATTTEFLGNLRRNLVADQYRQRVIRTYEILTGAAQTWPTAYNAWTEEYESAECLYLIFATQTVDGVPLIDQLRSRDIADIDEDGMPEIVDPWGTPVLWIRSPVGFFLKNRWVVDEGDSDNWPTVGELRDTIARLGPDPLDILRTDPRHLLVDDDDVTDQIDPMAVNAMIEVHQRTFFAPPMIVSAGPDGEFDLVEVKDVANNGRETVSDDLYNSTNVQPATKYTRTGMPFTHPSGYPNPVFFPDPFFSLPIQGGAVRPLVQRPGAVFDVDGDRTDDSADNVYPSLGI